MAHQPTVLVTDAARGSAVAIIRSLGRAGWRVVAADAGRLSPGRYSRHATARVLYPSPVQFPGPFADALESIIRHYGVDLLFPVTDDTILPIAAERDRFERFCKLALPSNGMLAAAGDKLGTVRLAEDLGVPTPNTHLVRTTEEALRHADNLNWPVVLKPQVSRQWSNGWKTTNTPTSEATIDRLTVTYAEDRERLAAHMRSFENRCAVLLQEYVPGIGHGIELLMEQGRPLIAFQHQRLREIPITGGASALRRAVTLDPTLYRYAVRLLAAWRWTGLAMVEFKIGARGPALMEINGRVWGSLPLAVHSGVDFPRAMAEQSLLGHVSAATLHASLPGEQVYDVDTGVPPYRSDVHSRNLELELVWIASVLFQRRRFAFLPMPRRREALWALLGLLRPTVRFDILSLRDPRPGLIELCKTVLKFAKHRNY